MELISDLAGAVSKDVFPEELLFIGLNTPKKRFCLKETKPTPPEGFIEYNHKRMKKCPNCGKENPSFVYGSENNGFQDKEVMKVYRAMNRVEEWYRMNEEYRPICPEEAEFLTSLNWNGKRAYNLFSTDLDVKKPKYTTMLKCHHSRFGMGKFTCCGALIWHDLFGKNWNYYYNKV